MNSGRPCIFMCAHNNLWSQSSLPCSPLIPFLFLSSQPLGLCPPIQVPHMRERKCIICLSLACLNEHDNLLSNLSCNIFSFLFVVEQHTYISFKDMLIHCWTLRESSKAGYCECPQKPWVCRYPCWALSELSGCEFRSVVSGPHATSVFCQNFHMDFHSDLTISVPTSSVYSLLPLPPQRPWFVCLF